MDKYIIYNNPEARKKKKRINEINDLMGIKLTGQYIVFAAQNYDEQIKNEGYARIFGMQGFCIKKGVARLGSGLAPKDFWDIYLKQDCDHMVWISKSIGDADDDHFTWVYSHELQHLKQSLRNPYFLTLQNELIYLLVEKGQDMLSVEIPTEYDAEQKAQEIFIDIFKSEKNCKRYKEKQKELSDYWKEHFAKFDEMNEMKIWENMAVEEAIIQFACKYQQRIKEIQQLNGNRHARYSLDIDELCSSKNIQKAIKARGISDV